MKLDKICRACLAEKSDLKPLFGACIPNMLMTCAAVQVMQGDGLPDRICTQCLQIVNRAYSFRQLCEKSDASLRHYINSIDLSAVSMQADKTAELFSGGSDSVLPQSSLFSDIFSDATSHTLVEGFTAQEATVVSDLADTMESLQTIAEQCLPEAWDADDDQLVVNDSSQETCVDITLQQLYTCQFCKQMFKDEWSLGNHIKMHLEQSKEMQIQAAYDVPSSSLEKGDFASKIHTCSVCGKVYGDEKMLKSHFKDAHPAVNDINEKKHVCSLCGKRYAQNKLLMMHMRSHTGERPLSCEICGKTFALPSSLHKHRFVHGGDKKHKCNICGKGFVQTSNLTIHLRTHTGEKPYVCSICGKACATYVNLENHMRIHTGEKPFRCTKCNSSFSSSGQLKKHTMRHTGEKPYQCWQCGKSFRQKDTRDTHVRYHTGERPFLCRLCPKRYIAASHLRTHMKTHTDDRKYRCNICLKRFMQASTLRTHLLTHSGTKPHCCQLCGKCFTQSGSLSAHIKNVHKNNC